jgi:hypothetical protein
MVLAAWKCRWLLYFATDSSITFAKTIEVPLKREADDVPRQS